MNPKQKMRFRIQVMQLVDNEIHTQTQSVPEQRFQITPFSDSFQSGSTYSITQHDISADFCDNSQSSSIPSNTQLEGYEISTNQQDDRVSRKL